MQSVLTQAERPENGMRERRCIVTGEVLPEARLIRFVLDPDGSIVPDIAAKLPGRGYWVSAERAAIERAATRRLFAKVAGQDVTASGDLAARTEAGMVQRMLSYLGLARRCGDLILGCDSSQRQIRRAVPPGVRG